MVASDTPRDEAPAVSEEDLASFSRNNASFALDLGRALHSSTANVVYSPFSISTALGMTYAGARTTTAQAIAKAMRFAADRRTNSVVVIATREQLVVAESVIGQIDDRPARASVKSISKEAAVRVKEGVPASDLQPTEKAMRKGNLQIQKLSNPDGLIVRSTDGNLAIEEVVKVLGELRPDARAAKANAPQVPDGLIATIRRQNQELKELRALVESLHPGSEKRGERAEKAIEPIRPTEEPIK